MEVDFSSQACSISFKSADMTKIAGVLFASDLLSDVSSPDADWNEMIARDYGLQVLDGFLLSAEGEQQQQGPTEPTLLEKDVGLIQLRSNRDGEVLKDLVLEDRVVQVKHVCLLSEWWLQLDLPEGFCPQDDIELTLMELDGTGTWVLATAGKGSPKGLEEMQEKVRVLFSKRTTAENGRVTVKIEKTKGEKVVRPFPCTSQRSTKLVLLRFQAKCRERIAVSLPLIVVGNNHKEPKGWDAKLKNSVETALSLLPDFQACNMWRMIHAKRAVVPVQGREVLQAQVQTLYENAMLKNFGERAYQKYKFCEDMASLTLRREWIVAEVIGRLPDDASLPLVHALCFADKVEGSEHLEIVFCCNTKNVELQDALFKAMDPDYVPTKKEQGHSFVSLPKLLEVLEQFKGRIDLFFPTDISNRRPVNHQTSKESSEVVTTAAAAASVGEKRDSTKVPVFQKKLISNEIHSMLLQEEYSVSLEELEELKDIVAEFLKKSSKRDQQKRNKN